MKRFKIILIALLSLIALQSKSQYSVKVPALITLKNGETIDIIHFGQLKCGSNAYSENYILIRGKYMDAVTEMKNYNEIEKIVLQGYVKPPANSLGNELGTLMIYKKDGVSVTLTDAELTMSCYGAGDKYNELIVQILNPISNQPSEINIETRNIQSIIFK